MKTPDRFNKPYFYLYLLLVLAVVSLSTLVLTLVFDRPGLAFFLSILLGLLAFAPLGSALDRLSQGLTRLQIGQPPQLETRRDFWNPLAGLLRQLNRIGGATPAPGPSSNFVEEDAARQERNRLGRELHDSIKQQLFSIQMSASAVEARWEEDPTGAHTALQDVLQSTRAALAEMNALLQSLSPVPLERVGLAQALQDQCQALAYRTGAQVTCEVAELPAEDWLPAGAMETLFRVAQEALSNIARHARAKNVSLNLAADPAKGLLVLTISDDGLGFDLAGTQPGGGLTGMRARLEALGGSFSLQTGVGKGVQLLAALPFQPPEQVESLVPVKANPFLNRAALVGLGGGILAAAALILPVMDSIGRYLDWGWDVSRTLGTAMILLAMLIGVLTGWLSARWIKPATLPGSVLSGALAGIFAGLTAFGLLVAGFAAVDGAAGLLDYGLRPASVAETGRLLSGGIMAQFQAVHRNYWSLLIFGVLYGSFGGLLTWRKRTPVSEGIPWEGAASLVFTLLSLGSSLALIGGSPALVVSESALVQMMQQAGIVSSNALLWVSLAVLGTPAFFYLLAAVANYGLLRREIQSSGTAAIFRAHWQAFNFGILGLVVAAGMAFALLLTVGDAATFSASLVLGLILICLVAAVPFFWLTVTTRQALLHKMVKVPAFWMYLAVAASLLLPILAFFGLISAGSYWIFPIFMALEALLILAVLSFRRRFQFPGQAAGWRNNLARTAAGWLAGAFALILPVLPMIASAVGILNLPVYFANALDAERLGWWEPVRWSLTQLVQNTFLWELGVFGGLLVLAVLAIGFYLLLLAARISGLKKRL